MPARLADGPRPPRPGWYDYPSLLMGAARAGAGALRRAVARRRAARRRRARARRRGGHVVARPARLRDGRGDRRRRRRRRRDDARRVLADGRHGRAADARASRACSRSRSRGGSSGPGSRSASPRRRSTRARSPPCPVVVAGWGRWRALGRAAALAVAGFALTSPFVLIHAGAAWDDISRVQRLARAGWLGFENDPVDAARLPRPALGGDRAAPAPRASSASSLRSSAGRRTDLVLLSFVGVYWLTLHAAAGPLRPLRAAARAGARRARREHPAASSRSRSSLLVAAARVERSATRAS